MANLSGIELPVVSVDPEELTKVIDDTLFSRTAAAFERVWHPNAAGSTPFLGLMDRAIQRMRGRRRMPITDRDPEGKGFGGTHRLLSPVALVAGSMDAYCVAVDADFDRNREDPKAPIADMLHPHPQSGMTVHRATPSYFYLNNDGMVTARYYYLAPIELVTGSMQMSEVAQVGLGAVYLALNASY